MSNETIIIKCSKCDRDIKVAKPDKPGSYKVACPHCNHAMQLQLNAKPLRMEGAKPENVQAGQQKRVSLVDKIVPYKNGSYVLKTPVPVNVTVGFVCQKCGKPVAFTLSQTGVQGVKCRHCQSLVYVKGIEATPAGAQAPQQPQAPQKPQQAQAPQKPKQPIKTKTIKPKHGNRVPGILSWGNIFRRKRFELREGTYVLGRNDSQCQSDIQLNDPEVSRRSVVIDVQRRDDGFYYFKLTVKKATNPVMHNNKPLAEGESVYMNYGDSLQLGRTVVNFLQMKNK